MTERREAPMCRWTTGWLLAMALAGGPAAAQTLTIGVGGAVTGLDPQFFNASPNNMVAGHFFDRLLLRDGQTRLQPGLAESVLAVAETSWEVRLRPGVTWHDGRPFTADDVAFSIARIPQVPNSPASFAAHVRAIARVEVVDPLTIRLHTAAPYAQMPQDLASFFIVSRHVGASAGTADYNSGSAVVGTGRFRLTGHRPGDRIEMARNDAHWAGVGAWRTVSYRIIANDAARTAALLSGDVEVIDQVNTADLARLRGDRRIGVSEIQGLRNIYIYPDFSRSAAPPDVADHAGRPLGANPFLDIRVRRALSLAINREQLTERVMEGTAAPTGQWLPAGSFGYEPSLVPRFDPDAARRLLADAGFPDGFRLTLSSPNDRYPNDTRIAQAIAQMWSRIGVQTQVQAMPFAAFIPRSARQDMGMRVLGFASSSGDAVPMLVNIINTFDAAARTGAGNHGRYSDPALDALTIRALGTLDHRAREELLRQAVRMAMDDVAVIPLYMLANVWAARRPLHYEPRMDEQTLAWHVRRSE
jgi:peptide/nickel transport system substrate-binding protein